MLAVQVSLESLAAEGPVMSPEGAHDAEGLVEHIVNLEDDKGDEVAKGVTNLFHDYFFMILLVRLSNQSVVVRDAARITQPRNPE
jgi:hypothetical protein